MKIYISGKISGIPEADANYYFTMAHVNLKAMGWDPVNPMFLPHRHGKTWAEFMREDIHALLTCEAIYMLDNWQESKGSRIEFGLAVELGMKIIFQ
jgi:hypothetical protein